MTPVFLSKVPVRFGLSDASLRYHVAVLFSPMELFVLPR